MPKMAAGNVMRVLQNKQLQKQLQIIKKGGYATSGSYVSQLSGVIRTYNLTKWDK